MYAALSLLILGSLGTKLIGLASGAVTSHNPGENWVQPSGATLDGCPTSCGNLSFNYPFGIGSRCSRGPDFDLTCNDTTVDSPRLFFRDGITEVIDNIDVLTDGNYYGPHTCIRASFRTIPMKSGVSVYHMPFKPPGSSFTIDSSTILNITGCDLDVYLVDDDKRKTKWVCRTVCPDQGITEMVAMHNCNGFGCCRVELVTLDADGFHFKFVRLHSKSNAGASSKETSQLWDRISITTDGYYGFSLGWNIRDQPTCVAAMRNWTTYACMSRHTECVDSGTYECSGDATCIDGGMASTNGYNCICDIGYTGNPYILDGCSNDKGYNPIPSRTDCTRWCGNISVQFPFGLEDGCFAREQFHLNCTNRTSSAVLLREDLEVIDMNVDKGTIKLQFDAVSDLFVDFELSVKWAAANLSCLEAQQNRSGYACVSMNSKCLPVNAEYDYVGYHCQCSDGFYGNPYIQSGCRDVDECREPNICQGVCRNTKGSYYCTKCPPNTEYDAAKMRCTTTKQQILFLGIIIGLSCGFSILVLSFSALFLIRRRSKYIQNQLRKEFFRKNQGLLPETLISSDETAHDRTKIFSLEELEKAINNFDPTRIIGRGGHGMVYKGMLSDQHVVAIKKSKVIEQCEINQFINEVAVLTQINHRNIVKLFGCCLETEVPLLVYDYVSSGSLSQVLHADASNGLSLSWGDYLRIALETAGALSYLHSAASISIFHRDVKSSNILLDGNYTAKVSDFGASRLVQTHIVTNVQGTFGYLDPEYFHTRQLNGKSDVYSFGVVLVELLLRMKHVFTSESGTVKSLSNYFLQEFNEGRITDIANSQVLEEATEEEINGVASLAERSLRLHGEERPTMKQVETELQTLLTKRMNSSQPDPSNGEQMQPRPLT